jgi:hypothetical protein
MIRMLQWLTRIGGLGAFVVGMMLGRIGYAVALRAHMTLGLIVALSLLVLALMAISARVRIPLAAVSVVWAVAVVYVGIMHPRWMPGGSHWIIQVVHAVLGICAMGLAEAMAGAITRKRTA